jgi:hypothetical protein
MAAWNLGFWRKMAASIDEPDRGNPEMKCIFEEADTSGTGPNGRTQVVGRSRLPYAVLRTRSGRRSRAGARSGSNALMSPATIAMAAEAP